MRQLGHRTHGKFSAILTAVLLVWLIHPAAAPGQSLSIFLRTGLSSPADHHVPVGASVQVRNDYDHELHNLRIEHTGSGKALARIDRFQSAQSFGLQFSAQGTYRLCFSLEVDSTLRERCVRIHAVSLQAA